MGNSITTTVRKSKALENNGRSLTPLRKPHFCFGASKVKALPPPDVKREPSGSPSEKARNITVAMESEKRMVKMEVGDMNSQGHAIVDRRPVENAANKPQMWAKLQLQILKKHKKVVADKETDGAEESTNKTQCDKVQDINGHVTPKGKSVRITFNFNLEGLFKTYLPTIFNRNIFTFSNNHRILETELIPKVQSTVAKGLRPARCLSR